MTRRLLRDVRVPAEAVENLSNDPSFALPADHDVNPYFSEGTNTDASLSAVNVYSGSTSYRWVVNTEAAFIQPEIVGINIPTHQGWIAWSIRLYCASGQPLTHAGTSLSTFSSNGYEEVPGDVVALTYDNYVLLSGSLNVADYPNLEADVRLYVQVGLNAAFDAPVPVGTEFYTDASMVTYGPTQAIAEARAATYFDGSTTPPAGMETYWTGEPNRSPSRLVSAGTSVLTVVRRNLAANSIATHQGIADGIWNGILGGSGGQVESAEPGPLYGVRDYFQVTAVGDSSTSSAFYEVPWPNRLTTNTQYASSLLVMVPRDMDAIILVSDGGQTIHSQNASLRALRWNLIELLWSTLNVEDAAISMGIYLEGDSLMDGESLRIGYPLIEEGTVVGTYFDGNTSPRTFWEEDDTSAMWGYS